MSEVQFTVRDAINRLKAANALGKTNLSDKGVDLPADEPTTIDVVDGIENIPTGASLNIAYGNTAPEDTTKLWVKTAQPQNVTVDYDIDNGVESVQALTAVLPYATNMLACGTVGTRIWLFGDGAYRWYDFDTDTEIITLHGSRSGLGRVSCGVVGTKIYLFGGDGTNTVVVYDTENDSFTTASASFPKYSINMSACGVVGTKCYIFGGFGKPTHYANLVDYDTIFVYDTVTGALTKLDATLPTAARESGVGVVGTKIYLFGGRNGDTTLLDTINVFDTETNTITTLPVTLSPITAQQSVATFGTKCYLFGGLVTSGNVRVSVDTIQVFDAETETLTTLTETLPQPLYSPGVGMVGNDVYLFGGASTQLGNVPLDTIYKFNITFPLAEGDVYLQSDVFRNKFTLVNAPTEVKTGVSVVYVGNAQNEAEYAEALLYDGSDWSPIV